MSNVSNNARGDRTQNIKKGSRVKLNSSKIKLGENRSDLGVFKETKSKQRIQYLPQNRIEITVLKWKTLEKEPDHRYRPDFHWRSRRDFA
mmetsp:Transcript_26368/g.54013  ORF Transcript_26368/g.54013 Transcript_26368/m.54013 type:complete len:90 (-) Transcript_26368:1262-1531(-)